MNVRLEDVLEHLGEQARDATVHVTRQPGGWEAGGEVELSALDKFHTRKVSGGRGEASYFPHLYARGSCRELPVAHSGSHGECPHQILACVTGAEREDVWEALCELTGFEPPTEEGVQREREKVKRVVLERLDAGSPQEGLRERSTDGIPPMFNHVVEQEVGPVVGSFARIDNGPIAGFEPHYLDTETGAVVTGGEISGVDMREHPHEEGRYEEIDPLSEEELDLLTTEDIREIRDAFLASRGFTPSQGG